MILMRVRNQKTTIDDKVQGFPYWEMWRSPFPTSRKFENETREIIVENKLWCINVVLLVVDQIMLGKNGQLFSLFLKKKVYIKYGSNS